MLLSLLASCETVAAQDAVSDQDVITPPRMVRQMHVQYPDLSREALVLVQFNLSPEGEVQQAWVVDGGFHDKTFEKAALRLIEGSRFSPQLRNGRPEGALGLTTPVRFVSGRVEPGVTPSFKAETRKVVDLLEQGDFAGAHFHTEWMLSEKVKLNYEFAALQSTLAYTQFRLKNYHEALLGARESTRHVRMESDSYVPGGKIPRLQATDFLLPKDLTAQLLRIRFAIAQENGFLLDAVGAHADLQGLNLVTTDEPSLAIFNRDVEQLLKGEALAAKVTMVQEGKWTHGLYHRSFAVANVRNGHIGELLVSCAGTQRRLRYAPGSNWSLPAGTQNCSLRVDAPPGTQFVISEFRDPPPGVMPLE